MFYVREVLDCICGVLIPAKVNKITSKRQEFQVSLIIFVTASETYDATTAAEQYFLTQASYTGIPVIAWNADNSGFTFGQDLSTYRIIQMAPPIDHQIRRVPF